MHIRNRIILSRITIVILSLLLGAFAFNTYQDYKLKKEDEKFFEKEKQLFLNELNDITNRYDSARLENTLKLQEITNYKDKIKALEVKILSSENTVKNLISYRKELEFLKEERKRLFKIADSLKMENDSLIEERNIVKTELEVQKDLSSELAKKNTQYQDAIKKASIIKASNINAKGIRVRSTGSFSETQRAVRVERIRVNFTLEANLFAKKGEHDIYIQILNPNNNIIGERKTVEFAGGLNLLYSSKETINYNNETYNASVFIKKDKDHSLTAGKYFISLFIGDKKLGNTILLLK